MKIYQIGNGWHCALCRQVLDQRVNPPEEDHVSVDLYHSHLWFDKRPCKQEGQFGKVYLPILEI